MGDIKHKTVDPGDLLESLAQLKRDLKVPNEQLGGQSYQCGDRDTMLLNFDKGFAPFADTAYRVIDRNMNVSILPTPYFPCTTSFLDLEKTMIADLKFETHHRGTYLLARVITSPRRATEILVLVEDEMDNAIALALYHQEEKHIRKATDIVEEGVVVLIKEPYVEVLALDQCRLRIDHLSDIEYVDESDERLPKKWRAGSDTIDQSASADALKLEGNELVGEGQYWRAIKKYTSALSRSVVAEESKTILRNRALAYLKTGQYDAVLSDIGYPLFDGQHSEKAFFRAAEALYNLGCFEECAEVLRRLAADFPDNKQAALMLKRALLRCKEKLTGKYNLSSLQSEVYKRTPPHLDHATHVGPIEIRPTADKGNGTFLTQAVKAGDLLLCEKAFGHARSEKSTIAPASYSLLSNLDTEDGYIGTLLPKLIQKLHKSPSLAPNFLSMHRGRYNASGCEQVDGRAVLDTFQVAHIMSQNHFGCPLTSEIPVHATLSSDDIYGNKEFSPEALIEINSHSQGLWIIGSYINHACNFNVERSFIGDMMIVRATKDLETGTEIVFPYKPFNFSQKERKRIFQKWGFECKCELCEESNEMISKHLPLMQERQRLINEADAICRDTEFRLVDTEKLSKLLDAAAKTYLHPADEVPRLLLWQPQVVLSRAYLKKFDMEEGLESVIQTFEHLGFVFAGLQDDPAPFKVVEWGRVETHVMELFLHLQLDFAGRQKRDKAVAAENYAKTVWRITVGEDENFNLRIMRARGQAQGYGMHLLYEEDVLGW